MPKQMGERRDKVEQQREKATEGKRCNEDAHQGFAKDARGKTLQRGAPVARFAACRFFCRVCSILAVRNAAALAPQEEQGEGGGKEDHHKSVGRLSHEQRGGRGDRLRREPQSEQQQDGSQRQREEKGKRKGAGCDGCRACRSLVPCPPPRPPRTPRTWNVAPCCQTFSNDGEED